MSQISDAELDLLNHVADELREVFAERGHRVDVAMETDPAFGSGWSRAAVTRDLVVDATSGAASRIGLDFRAVKGSGREFRTTSGIVERRFRLRRAHRSADGELIINASSDSALALADESEASLFDQELWAFAWILSADGMIAEVLLAEVVGFVEGSPGHLKLGRVIGLGGGEAPSRGFRPTDEGLDGFDDDEDLGDEYGTSAS